MYDELSFRKYIIFTEIRNFQASQLRRLAALDEPQSTWTVWIREKSLANNGNQTKFIRPSIRSRVAMSTQLSHFYLVFFIIVLSFKYFIIFNLIALAVCKELIFAKDKCKILPRTGHEGPKGSRVIVLLFL